MQIGEGMTNKRDCENCAHAHPFGGENDNRCDAWECEYINRQEAIEAYKARKVGGWIRTGRTNVYGGEELMCPFCGDRVMVQNIEYELYCRQCGALLGDRMKGE